MLDVRILLANVTWLRACAACPPYKHKWQGVWGPRGFRQLLCVLLRKCHLHYKYRQGFGIISFKGQLSRVWTCCTQLIRVSIYEAVSAFLITPLPRLKEKSQIHVVILLGIIVIISHIQSQRLTQINLFKVTVGIELGSIGLFCFMCKEKQWQMEPQTYALVCKGHASSGS